MKVGQHFDDINADIEMEFGGKTKKDDAKYTGRTVADNLGIVQTRFGSFLMKITSIKGS